MPESKQIKPKRDFKEALDEYFALKSEYETKKKAMKHAVIDRAIKKGISRKNALKMAKRVVPKCLACKRNVSMIFERQESKYIARCGDHAKPCGLKIELVHGAHGDYISMIAILNKDIAKSTENIIVEKMNALFNYRDEKTALEEFNRVLKDYQSDVNLRTNLENELLNHTEKEHKYEMIKAKINKLHELKRVMNAQRDAYLKQENGMIIRGMTNIYLKEYMPEVHNLRMLKYPVMESNFTNVDMTESQLYQQDVSFENVEYHEEEIEIKKFHLGAEKNEEDVIIEDEYDDDWRAD